MNRLPRPSGERGHGSPSTRAVRGHLCVGLPRLSSLPVVRHRPAGAPPGSRQAQGAGAGRPGPARTWALARARPRGWSTAARGWWGWDEAGEAEPPVLAGRGGMHAYMHACICTSTWTYTYTRGQRHGGHHSPSSPPSPAEREIAISPTVASSSPAAAAA